MKANSPICAMEKPHCMATLSGWPERMKLLVPSTTWPSRMAAVMAQMGSQWATSTAGSTSMPTDTKKMAPKRSFTGLTTRSMFSASTVSARMLPIMKAPKAGL